MNASKLTTVMKDNVSRAMVAGMLLASGAYSVQAAEFTDRVNSAKAVDTKGMRESVKSGADNFGFMIGIVGMVFGLVMVLIGFFMVASASRSEGRKPAAPGWVMVGVGGALGAGTAIYLWLVGALTGAVS